MGSVENEEREESKVIPRFLSNQGIESALADAPLLHNHHITIPLALLNLSIELTWQNSKLGDS